MVKFGRHLSFFTHSELYEETQNFIVPYNTLRDKIGTSERYNPSSPQPRSRTFFQTPQFHSWCFNTPPSPEQDFTTAWQQVLSAASTDFTKSTTACYRTIYSAISTHPDSRGAPLEMALQIYTPYVEVSDARDMLVALKGIHSTARVNAEALRKLVKKYDKQVGGSSKLSEVLLPELYGSIVAVGQGTVEMAAEIIRCILEDREYAQNVEDAREVDDYDEKKENQCHYPNNHNHNSITNNNVFNMDAFTQPLNDMKYEMTSVSSANSLPITFSPSPLPSPNTSLDRHTADQLRRAYAETLRKSAEEMGLTRRANETQWLNSITTRISNSNLSHLVAHRGFHDPGGRSDLRPLENSLSAFEAAWSAGIHLCECDVALTRDEKIVLAHDEDFLRLALDPSRDKSAGKKVGDLTLKELIALTLKNGVRAPLLIDVLRSAAMIGGEARLVIEIKPGNTDVGMAVARLLGRYPDLMKRVAAIISFDLWCMHQLSTELLHVTGQLGLWEGNAKGSTNTFGYTHPSAGTMGPMGFPRSSFGTVGAYPSNGFLPGSAGMKAFPSNGMLAQSYGSFSHLLTMEEDDEPTSSTTTTGEDSKTSSNPELPTMLSPVSVPTSPLPPPPPIQMPSLLLLTVASAPEHPAELWMDIEDTSPVDGWLGNNSGKLDGIYVRYQAKMKEPKGAAAMKALSAKYEVGVWLLKGEDPDDNETLQYLVEECGVSYFNTDLPRDF